MALFVLEFILHPHLCRAARDTHLHHLLAFQALRDRYTLIGVIGVLPSKDGRLRVRRSLVVLNYLWHTFAIFQVNSKQQSRNESSMLTFNKWAWCCRLSRLLFERIKLVLSDKVQLGSC